MNKTQNVTAFAEKAGITKTDASKFFNALMGVMADNIVEGDGEISIPDFGRFSIKHVAERQGVNPATGEKITIAARDKVVFKASDSLPYFSREHLIWFYHFTPLIGTLCSNTIERRSQLQIQTGE